MSPDKFHLKICNAKSMHSFVRSLQEQECTLPRSRSQFETPFLFHLLNNLINQVLLESFLCLHHHNALKFTTTCTVKSIDKNNSTSFKELSNSLLHFKTSLSHYIICILVLGYYNHNTFALTRY